MASRLVKEGGAKLRKTREPDPAAVKQSSKEPQDPEPAPLAEAQPSVLDPRALPTPHAPASEGAELLDTERQDLATCEAAIDTLRMAFWAAGKALQVIRDARLYRETYGTFEEYVEDRWDMRRAHADRLIRAWPLAGALDPIGSKIVEGQVRELLPVAERHGQDAAVAVYRTIAEADGVRVTAAVIKGAVGVLPDDDHFDTDKAVEQIRAYLAGQTAPSEPSAPSPAELWAAEAGRVRSALRRIRRDVVRAAAVENPEEARELAAELRALADEVEQDVQ